MVKESRLYSWPPDKRNCLFPHEAEALGDSEPLFLYDPKADGGFDQGKYQAQTRRRMFSRYSNNGCQFECEMEFMAATCVPWKHPFVLETGTIHVFIFFHKVQMKFPTAERMCKPIEYVDILDALRDGTSLTCPMCERYQDCDHISYAFSHTITSLSAEDICCRST